MVDDHPISCFEAPAARARFYNLTAWFVARDHTLITLRTLSEVLVIYAADIRAANSRSFDSKENLAVIRRWHRESTDLNGTVSRQKCSLHRRFHETILPVFPFWKAISAVTARVIGYGQ
jgi:hypothetical protein